MLVVKTKIGQSKIEGIGLFADQFITKGTVTWKFDPKFDIYFDPGEVEEMSELKKDLITHYAYLSKKSGKYVYSIDNTRFANHSTNPNIAEDEKLSQGSVEICTIAMRDIQIGEEMTIDYRAIDVTDENGEDKYLK